MTSVSTMKALVRDKYGSPDFLEHKGKIVFTID